MAKKTRISSGTAQSPWHKVDPGEDLPSCFNVAIEILMGSSNKYELDKKTGMLKLDRVLYSAAILPGKLRIYPSNIGGRRRPVRHRTFSKSSGLRHEVARMFQTNWL
jgi:inorganic pyrophosphatase